MRALTYHKAHHVSVDTHPDPILQDPDDIILRVTATAICGSDLHLFRGKVPGMEAGDILGHEFMGIVEDVGPGVTKVKRGDRVVVPFTIACGHCFFCEKAMYAACETTNPSRGTIMNKKSRFAAVPACLATPICMAVTPVARPSWCGCRAPMWARWCCPQGWPMSKCCSCPTSCPPVTRQY